MIYEYMCVEDTCHLWAAEIILVFAFVHVENVVVGQWPSQTPASVISRFLQFLSGVHFLSHFLHSLTHFSTRSLVDLTSSLSSFCALHITASESETWLDYLYRNLSTSYLASRLFKFFIFVLENNSYCFWRTRE